MKDSRLMVVTDVDGTITDEDGKLDLSAVQELRGLETSGVAVGLVSGRPYPLVMMLGEYLGITGPLIAENGGVGLWRGHEFQLGDRSVVDAAVALFQQETTVHPTPDNQWRITDYTLNSATDIEQLRKLISAFNLGVELHTSSLMIHVSKKGINKAVGLEQYLTAAGIDQKQVIVAGDSLNDMPLFERFQFTIAPANSAEAIRKMAFFNSQASFGKGFIEGIQHFRKHGYLP